LKSIQSGVEFSTGILAKWKWKYWFKSWVSSY